MSTGPASYWHTELRPTRAARTVLRRGQVRIFGATRWIMLRPSRHAGEWIVGRYSSDGITYPAETWLGRTLRQGTIVGRVVLTVREVV